MLIVMLKLKQKLGLWIRGLYSGLSRLERPVLDSLPESMVVRNRGCKLARPCRMIARNRIRFLQACPSHARESGQDAGLESAV